MLGVRGGGGGAVAAPMGGGGGGAYGPIGGPLPFSGGGTDYASAYNAALQFNSANYGQILQGYNATRAAQQQGQQAITQGYNTLQGNVLGGIQGMDAAQRQAIKDQYVAGRGQASQELVNRGLGNSTIQSGVDRGFLYDKAKADIALTNSTQGVNAQYQSQLGLAGLGYQNQALMQNTGLAKDQLDWLNSINAAYPDASRYAEMARLKGASGGGMAPGAQTGGYSGGKDPSKGASTPSYNGSGYGGGGAYGAVYSGRTPPSGYSPGQTIEPAKGYYPYDPADPYWSTQEGQAGGGGTMGVGYNEWMAPTEDQAGGVVQMTPGGDGTPSGGSEYYGGYY